MMQSSVWSGVPVVSNAATGGDPASLLNTQLANALSTMGDAHFWEESISPSTIRSSLASSDPSNPNSTPTLLRGMKWLLASISKGRNVSDFYPHVVKLVGASSLEVRKMVYMFLVQYADHDSTTRELSLLSINSFQRGLADPEQLIRALALRVLTSIRVPDIVQIQILGIQKCASDMSPYVRKCAANALAKIQDPCSQDAHLQKMLVDIMSKLLDTDDSTMVLTSAIIAFIELCPERLELLHRSYRKLCHQMVDMDEWGQVVVIDVLQRYCRTFFAAPRGVGSAEAIDAESRVVRTVHQAQNIVTAPTSEKSSTTGKAPPVRNPIRKIKRRVVKKGFYSDEEDESTEEEVYQGSDNAPLPVAKAARLHANITVYKPSEGHHKEDDLEDEHLDEDHRLLLRSTFPLLKSRNSAVVLAVCSLHYYCGVASIRVRSSLGKAMVRIHRDRREIQYAVLTSIRSLVKECPLAFTPFLQDFFVKGVDPSFTRLIKLEILTLLAIEPQSIEAVLTELKAYVRHDDDIPFCCASIRAVGKVVEVARIVYDRHGQKSGNVQKQRRQANIIGLNALNGLLTLTRASSDAAIVGECCAVMQRILLQLNSDNQGDFVVQDPNRIQESSIKRLLLLLVTSLASHSVNDDSSPLHNHENDFEDTLRIPPSSTAVTLWIVGEWITCSNTLSSTLQIERDTASKVGLELARLMDRCFPVLESCEKMQVIHFATKLLVSTSCTRSIATCEHILSMARVDIQADIRDRARMESNLIHASIGLKYDVENLITSVSRILITDEEVKNLLLASKPPSSSLSLVDENDDQVHFRFGTLSSLVNRRATSSYLSLPEWAAKNSPSHLREGLKAIQNGNKIQKDAENVGGWKVDSFREKSDGFYDSDVGKFSPSYSLVHYFSLNFFVRLDGSEEDDTDDDSDDNSEEVSESDSDTDSEDSEPDDDIAPIEGTHDIRTLANFNPSTIMSPNKGNEGRMIMNTGKSVTIPIINTPLVDLDGDDEDETEDEEDEEDDDDDEEDSSWDDEPDNKNIIGNVHSVTANLLGMPMEQQSTLDVFYAQYTPASTISTPYASSLEGLVMNPVVVERNEKRDPDIERDSSNWIHFLRPELAGGLSVQGRYLRSPTREKEARLISVDSSNSSVTLLQLQFQNLRNDMGVLRRIRLLSRNGPSGCVGAKRIALPPEITELPKNTRCMRIIAIEFASLSDREGTLLARFEVKSDRGNYQIEIRPPLAELVTPLPISIANFDDNMNRLQGFQRLTWNFKVEVDSISGLEQAVLKQISLRPMDEIGVWTQKHRLRLAAKLPASTDKLFIDVQCNTSGAGTMTVCCDNALVSNSIMDTLKKAFK
jgi:AP-3 complex subunit beta